MMASVQKVLRRVLTLFGLFGITFVVILLILSEKGYSYLLKAAEYALGIGVIALLLEVLAGLLGVKQRFSRILLPTDGSGNLVDEYGPEWAEINHRRELLKKRLQIDEPRRCSKNDMPCTCWSFCGGDPDLVLSAKVAEFTPLKFVQMSGDKAEVKTNQLPSIDRDNITDCPF